MFSHSGAILANSADLNKLKDSFALSYSPSASSRRASGLVR